MEYNTKRGDLQYREYGRNVRKMIDYVCTMPESDKKNSAVKVVVAMMGQVSGVSMRDDVMVHKIWDHLMVMSAFQLESCWPYSPEDLEALKQRAKEVDDMPRKRLPYKNSNISRRHYGSNLESMMRKMKEMPDGEEYQTLAVLLAQQAKRSYLVWNGDLSDDDIVVNQMVETSDDTRIADKLMHKGIYVPHGTLPVDLMNGKKKKKKK